MTRFSAVTFDLWNTLLVETGEGLIAPRVRRWQQVLQDAPGVDLSGLEAAHIHCLTQYKAAWAHNEQFCSREAVAAACDYLELQPDEHTRDALIESFHDAGLDSEIELVAGAHEVLSALRDAEISTAIICDIGLTPSTALTQRLRGLGILDLIDVLAWSDVFGAYKPDPSIFRWTLAELDVSASSACHVGDRLRTDVGGARATGMTTVRFRGVFDDPAPLPDADHVVDHLSALPALVLP